MSMIVVYITVAEVDLLFVFCLRYNTRPSLSNKTRDRVL